ncbi:hypothetical protein K488DRAFT_27037, partial [Vararia minispora EC-137]
HHDTWRLAQILHRDLSLANLMMRRDESGRLIGVLNDWDLAKDGHPDMGDRLTTFEMERTGTVPFMALDLLKRQAGVQVIHVYRHDLEAGIWVLPW